MAVDSLDDEFKISSPICNFDTKMDGQMDDSIWTYIPAKSKLRVIGQLRATAGVRTVLYCAVLKHRSTVQYSTVTPILL